MGKKKIKLGALDMNVDVSDDVDYYERGQIGNFFPSLEYARIGIKDIIKNPGKKSLKALKGRAKMILKYQKIPPASVLSTRGSRHEIHKYSWELGK